MSDPLMLMGLGALLALDGTSVGQFMISRPMVAGILTGWLLGDPLLGLLVGGLMEVFIIPVFPVGGADFPEGGPPALVGVVAAWTVQGAGGVAFGVVLGLLLSRFGAFSIRLLRRINGRLAPDPSREVVTPGRLARAHQTCILLDSLRGAGLVGLGLLGLSLVPPGLAGIWPLSLPWTLAFLIFGAAVPAGAFIRSLGGWKRRGVLFGAGAAGFLIGSFLL